MYTANSTSTMILWYRLVKPVVRIDITEYEKTEIKLKMDIHKIIRIRVTDRPRERKGWKTQNSTKLVQKY